MFVIKNITKAPLILDGVSLPPGKQYQVGGLTKSMEAARDEGLLQALPSDETLEERRKDIEAINSFRP